MPKLKVRVKRCEKCHHGVVQPQEEGESRSELKVKCLKRSPTVDWNSGVGQFPIMSAYDHCGQFRERKEIEEEEIEIG